MSILFSLILAFVALGICLYHRTSQLITLVVIGAIFAVATLITQTTPILFGLYIIACGFIAIPSVRRRLFSKPTLTVFRKILPAMSQTEKEAIDAGTVWWEAELFKGKPDWKKLTEIKAPQLSAEEQAFIDGPVNEVCKMANDFEITHELADLPPEIWRRPIRITWNLTSCSGSADITWENMLVRWRHLSWWRARLRWQWF